VLAAYNPISPHFFAFDFFFPVSRVPAKIEASSTCLLASLGSAGALYVWTYHANFIVLCHVRRALKTRIKAAYPEAFEGLQEYQVPDQ